jgi:hypothetical protein
LVLVSRSSPCVCARQAHVRVCAHTDLSKFILELAGKFEVVIRLHRWFLRIV